MKNYYDKYHISLLLNSENFIILKLHHEYCIFDIKNKKLFIQQVEKKMTEKHIHTTHE